MRTEASVRDVILRVLDNTFARRNWGHLGFRRATRGLTVREAGWHPLDGSHTIWEQINHILYWKRHVLERLRGRRPRSRQAWPAGERTAADLRRTLAECVSLHRAFRDAVARLTPDARAETTAGGRSRSELLLGSLAHECYHIGQIMALRARYRRRGRKSPLMRKTRE